MRYSFTMQDFEAWLKHGIEMGWCGPAICYAHDGMPMSEPEETFLQEGNDICIHIIRLYEDAIHKKAVEANHGPSTWDSQKD